MNVIAQNVMAIKCGAYNPQSLFIRRAKDLCEDCKVVLERRSKQYTSTVRGTCIQHII